MASVVEYRLNPLVEWNMRVMRLKNRILPTIVTLLEFAIVISVFFYFFIPYVTNEVGNMIAMLAKYSKSSIDIPYISDRIHHFLMSLIDENYLRSLMSHEDWMEMLKAVTNDVWGVVGTSLNIVFFIFSVLLSMLYLIFILLDFQKIFD